MKTVYAELSNKLLKDLKVAEVPDEASALDVKAAQQLIEKMNSTEIAKQDLLIEIQQDKFQRARSGLKRILSASGEIQARRHHTTKKASFSNLNVGEVERHILSSFLVFKRKKASRTLITELPGSPKKTNAGVKVRTQSEQPTQQQVTRPFSAIALHSRSRRVFSFAQKPSSAAKRFYRPKSQNSSMIQMPESRVQSPVSKASQQVQQKLERLYSAQGPSTDDNTTDERVVFTTSSSKKEDRHLLQASSGQLKSNLTSHERFTRKQSSPNFSGFTAENPSFLKPAQLMRIVSNKSRLILSRPVIIQF